MFDAIHTVLHIFGICPDSVGFLMISDYLRVIKHYVTLIKTLIL
jgi:hypothetical protein